MGIFQKYTIWYATELPVEEASGGLGRHPNEL
jgi:hypothetical protein